MVFKGTVESDFLKTLDVDLEARNKFINFAATDFLTLRQGMIDYVKAVYPLDYNYISESDFGMMLIELVAYMGHVLSYKADYLSYENFLRTARTRKSVKNLLDLIGIRLKGPISSAANAKITLDETFTIPEEDKLVIEAPSRVINITSPEDGAPLTYTLYKVAANGDIDVENSEGNINLYENEKVGNEFTNLVLLEGSFIREDGAFSNTESIKSIKLSQSPVVEGSVLVYINGDDETTAGRYKQVESVFFASGPDDKVFQIATDSSYAATILFPDSNVGKSPNITDSYTIFYRVGGGTRGNIRKESLNSRISCSLGGETKTATIENTSAGTGGANAETISHAKRYGPKLYRSLNRLVTLDDYDAFANTYMTSYGSVGKATASVRRAYSSANIIDLFVLEKASDLQLRKATPEFKRQLVAGIDEKKMITDEVVVVDGLIRTIDTSITARVDKQYKANEETIKAKIRAVILSYFNVDNWRFGQYFVPGDLAREIFEINEVRFASIDNIPETIVINFNEIIQLNNFNITIHYV